MAEDPEITDLEQQRRTFLLVTPETELMFKQRIQQLELIAQEEARQELTQRTTRTPRTRSRTRQTTDFATGFGLLEAERRTLTQSNSHLSQEHSPEWTNFPTTETPLAETPKENPETRRTLTPSSTLTGLKPIEFEEKSSPNTPKPPESDILNTSTNSPEELDPFQRLLQELKNSLRSPKIQPEAMAEDKKLSGSRPRKEEPVAEEAVIGSAMPVQVVSAVKEVKAALPRAFMGA
ncbi:hypothetical protein Moror_12013 [Moniliophthora roreri MCA 2997]|uniref:Uncharacterized protein n=1 Tax=Moniliophthora roreri (strain MCA 2997) TaxID=1381753 RepID=V2WA35_MONRO|nr:hypothetical protein Moror_12013 [Moniliophthora roreri MCA 2997]